VTCWTLDREHIDYYKWTKEFGPIFVTFMKDHTPTPTDVGGGKWGEKVTRENFIGNEVPAQQYLNWFVNKMIENFEKNSKKAKDWGKSLKTDSQIKELSDDTPDKEHHGAGGRVVYKTEPQGINKYKINGLDLKNLLMEYFRNKFSDPTYWDGEKVLMKAFAQNIINSSTTFPQFFNCSK